MEVYIHVNESKKQQPDTRSIKLGQESETEIKRVYPNFIGSGASSSLVLLYLLVKCCPFFLSHDCYHLYLLSSCYHC